VTWIQVEKRGLQIVKLLGEQDGPRLSKEVNIQNKCEWQIVTLDSRKDPIEM